MKIDVFLLAAGEGSRMFPLSSIMEKSLLPVDGKPVIRIIVENLTKPEVARHLRKITICCLSKFRKQFEHEFRDMPSIEFKTFEEPMGTYTTWFLARNHSDQTLISDWSLIHYADCITDIDYVDFITSFFNRVDVDRYGGSIAVTNNVKHDYSEVDVYPATCIVTKFHEKPKLKGYTWSGIALLHKNVGRYYKYKEMDFAFDVFPKMIEDEKLVAHSYSGSWIDVGNLNSYRKLCEMYSKS